MAADTPANAFQRTAHAKLNLCLHVTGQQADGYHLIDSLVGFAAFGDQVSVSGADADSFEVKGAFSSKIDDISPEDNLVIKARDWLRARHVATGDNVSCVNILLDKSLPVASGLGGGSADAAAALGALARIWRSPARWLEDNQALASELGADVPMCLHQSPLRVGGIGEEIAPWHRVPMLPCVLVNPGTPVSTPVVFSSLANRDNDPIGDVPPIFEGVADLASWLDRNTRNDLQPAAENLCPAIGTCIGAINQSGALMARMSGSGASCFGLYETIDTARTAADAIAQSNPGWFVQATAILPSPPLHDEDYGPWVESMEAVRSLH